MPDDGGLAAQFERFRSGQMSTEEADRYRESLRQNPDLLDDETRAIIEREHLLDPPAAAPPPAAEPVRGGRTPFGGTGGLAYLGLALDDLDEAEKEEQRRRDAESQELARLAAAGHPEAVPTPGDVFDPGPPPAASATDDDDLIPIDHGDGPPPGRSRVPIVAAGIGGIVVLAAGLITFAMVGRAGQPNPTPAAAASAASTPTPAKTPVPPALSATVTGSYSGAFSVMDSKCYSSGYLFKYEEDYLLKATDGSLWLVNIVPDLNGSPGFFFALQTSDSKPDPNHTYFGYGSGPGQSVTITPGQGGSVNHDLFIVNTNTPAGHLQMAGACPAGSPSS